MDGTGLLFEEFLSFYDGDSQVIALPVDGSQDYASLANYITRTLPVEDCIILAESFSGGIVPHLLNGSNQQIKGIIFVASFLTCPNKALLEIAKRLPIKKLARLPFSTSLLRLLFLGRCSTTNQISMFKKVLQSVPDKVLRARIQSMIEMQAPRKSMTIPAIYIQATEDRLVSTDRWGEFADLFEYIRLCQVKGPHFVLQSLPEESAERVFEAVVELSSC